MSRGAPGKDLPASHDHIDIGGVELETVADAACHFGGDQTRAGPEKRVIDRLTGTAVVVDWAAHALDRLLGAMSPNLLALVVAERVVVGDLPDRRLRAVASPMAYLALAHSVPTCFVLFPGDVAHVWHGALHGDVVAADLAACGLQLRAQIIWAKQHFTEPRRLSLEALRLNNSLGRVFRPES